MPFMRNVLKGLAAYRRVPRVLFKHGLWPYQFLPAIVGLLLTIGLVVAFYFIAHGVTNWIDGMIEIPVTWLDEAMNLAMWIITFLALAAGFVLVHKRIILIVLSPFLGKIAEETVKAIKGAEYAQSVLTFRESLWRSTKVNLRYLIREIIFTLLFLPFGLIPIIGSIFSAGGIFLTESRYLGYGLMDFPLEHRGLNAKESGEFARRRMGISTGLGAGYLMILMIPVIGWMFAPTFGTVAGTLLALDELEKEPPPIR